MTNRMIFFPRKRRSPSTRTIFAALGLTLLTGTAFAAGLHVGTTYATPDESPRLIVSSIPVGELD